MILLEIGQVYQRELHLYDGTLFNISKIEIITFTHTGGVVYKGTSMYINGHPATSVETRSMRIETMRSVLEEKFLGPHNEDESWVLIKPTLEEEII